MDRSVVLFLAQVLSVDMTSTPDNTTASFDTDDDDVLQDDILRRDLVEQNDGEATESVGPEDSTDGETGDGDDGEALDVCAAPCQEHPAYTRSTPFTQRCIPTNCSEEHPSQLNYPK
jgi:hypothetical protein